MNATTPFTAFSGLDLLSTAIVLVDAKLVVRHVNPAAENLFAVSSRQLLGHPLQRLVGDATELAAALDNALRNNWSYTGHNILIKRAPDVELHVDCTVTPVEAGNARMLLEVRPIDQQLKAAREEQLAQQQQANRELVRNLAHEIKNPLGGIRGSAQLLERELESEPLKEYTQVIIEEADRLQDLMQRLLSSHRVMQPALVNIHEILERVRRLIHAEYHDVSVKRDYDTSLPDITGDREQLLQAILNISRNAAQAMKGKGEIIFARARRAGHPGQEALPTGTRIASDRQRSRHSRRKSATGFSIPWCRAAKTAAGWVSPSPRASSSNTAEP
jgi:two-component system nitrogen regulation sensor histidine kinase GlnL